MDQTDPTADFDGCRRACRQQGAHTLVSGECEHAPEPEPTASLPRVYTAADGFRAVGFDQYTVPELAELIGPALRGVKPVLLSEGEYSALARAAAHVIVHRNDEPAAAPAAVSPSPSRAAVLLDAADHFDRMGRTVLSASQARDELHRLAAEDDGAEAQQQDEARPARGDQFEQWLKMQRNAHGWQGSNDRRLYDALDNLLDLYRLHADTGKLLGEHVCEGRVAGDCECLEQQPTRGA